MTAWPMPELTAGAERVFLDDCCANCLTSLSIEAGGLFCHDLCRQVAGTVRYLRAVYRDGRILEPDVNYAVSIRLAHLQSGGYDERSRRLPANVRVEVMTRDKGLCVKCGAPGVEIDHIEGPSGVLDNLQLLCTNCHRGKTGKQLVPASEEERTAVAELYARRVIPPTPLLLADDEHEWRAVEASLRSARRRRLQEHMAERGVDARHPRRPWAEAVAEHDDAEAPVAAPVTEDDDSTYGPDSYFARTMNRDD